MSLRKRLEEIRTTVKTDRKVLVSDLSRRFGVSEETIRRDMEKLEAEGLITRTYGGAVLNQENSAEKVDFDRRAQTNVEKKRIIAKLAAGVLPHRTTISADASSTVAETLKMLGSHEDITVLTNSIKAIDNLADTGIRLISTGGIVNRGICAFQGPVAQRILDSYHTEYALISCKALNMVGGAYDSNEEEVELKRSMIEHSSRVVMLVDSSKFDKLAFAQLVDFDRIHMLITDRAPVGEWKDFLEGRGVKVLFPSEESGN